MLVILVLCNARPGLVRLRPSSFFVAPISLFLPLPPENAPFFLAAEHARRPAGSERIELNISAKVLVLVFVLSPLFHHNGELRF